MLNTFHERIIMTSYSSKEMNIMGAKAFVDSINESDEEAQRTQQYSMLF